MKTWAIRHQRMLWHLAAFVVTRSDAHWWEVLHYHYSKRFTNIP